jgi:hypothetical protein
MAYISNKLTHWLGRQASTPDEQYMLLTEKILAKKELLFSRYGYPIDSTGRYPLWFTALASFPPTSPR